MLRLEVQLPNSLKDAVAFGDFMSLILNKN